MNGTPSQFGPRAPNADLRASDAERDAAMSELSDHFQAGRLDMEEFEQRIAAVAGAHTRGEIARLLQDLPGPPVAAQTDVGRGPRGPLAGFLAFPALAAFAVIAAVAIAVSGTFAATHGRWAPWPLIPLAFIVLSRLRRCHGYGHRRWR